MKDTGVSENEKDPRGDNKREKKGYYKNGKPRNEPEALGNPPSTGIGGDRRFVGCK